MPVNDRPKIRGVAIIPFDKKFRPLIKNRDTYLFLFCHLKNSLTISLEEKDMWSNLYSWQIVWLTVKNKDLDRVKSPLDNLVLKSD